MTENEARGYIQGKLNCMNKCDVFEREDKLKYNKDICDDCEYCYSQGNFGQQKEAFEIAIEALEFKSKICHCRECIHWVNGVAGCTEFVKFCNIGKYMVGENGYCVYGEWKEDKGRWRE